MVLSKELALKIRKELLAGKLHKDIREELDIKEGTWDYWNWNNTIIPDYGQGFRDFVKSAKHEVLLSKAEKVSREVLDLITVNEEGKIDQQLLKIKHDEAKFLRSTLGKIDFSTRVENDLTSKGKELPTPIIKLER